MRRPLSGDEWFLLSVFLLIGLIALAAVIANG